MSGYLLKLFAISFCVTIFAYSVNAQNQFKKKTFLTEKDTLPYNILLPEDYTANLRDSQEKTLEVKQYPLVLFLHGAGERGTDNLAQIIHIEKLFLNTENQKKFQAFVLAPQCPPGKRWVEVPWSAKKHLILEEPSWAIRKTKA